MEARAAIISGELTFHVDLPESKVAGPYLSRYLLFFPVRVVGRLVVSSPCSPPYAPLALGPGVPEAAGVPAAGLARPISGV